LKCKVERPGPGATIMDFLTDTDLLDYSPVKLMPDAGRTIMRPFVPQDPPGYDGGGVSRPQRIADRVLSLPDAEVGFTLHLLLQRLRTRMRNPEAHLMGRFDEVNGQSIARCAASQERGQLIGAYFCAEYSFEAAALFNPSMVRHLECPVLPDGRAQFVLSLRGVGEGHLSSVTFRTGRWSRDTGFEIDTPTDEGEILRLAGTEVIGDDTVYNLTCVEGCPVSDVVIFPATESQRQGIEDMRLVVFEDESSEAHIYGTYTAYNGRDGVPEMMHRTPDRRMTFRKLDGRLATGKGMALFPRKVNGRYMMLSRQDQENVWLLWSDDLYEWDEGIKLLAPAEPWEFVQLGNCGSPIEIDEGWLVLTHAVGPVRSYTMGACLLDKHDPSRVIARMRSPLMQPGQVEGNDGYVPNVVYSCGGMVHDRTLLLPFAVADTYTRFASVPVDRLLAAMH